MRKFRNTAARLSLMMYIKLIRKIKRKGGIKNIHHSRLRHNLLYCGNFMHQKYMTYDIKKVMASFFLKQMMIQELMVKFKKFRKTIDMMIKKIQNRPESFRAKHEIIVNAFERAREEIQQKVKEENDQSMK